MFHTDELRSPRSIRRAANLYAIPLVVLLVSLTPGQRADAHGYIIRSIPDNQAVLAHAPSRIQVWFTENLEPKFSALTLSNDQGQTVPLTEMGVSSTNRAQISARLPNNLPDGAYIATIQAAFASDGHVVTDTLVFWIGQKSAGLASNGPSQDANTFEVLWRIPMYLGTILLFGATFLVQAVLLPAWSNPAYRAGMLPPRVMARLNWIVGSALALALIGCILALLQQASILFASDVGSVLQRGLWNVVLSSTQFGEALLWRIVLLAVSGALLYLGIYLTTRQPQWVSLAWTLNAVIAAFVLATMSVSSHAAGSTLWPLAAIGVDWLHLLANAAWIGSLGALVLLLPAVLSPLSAPERQSALRAVLLRFSSVAEKALWIVIATGLFSALLVVRQPSDMPDTHYGLTLAAKILLIVPLLLLALYHHLSVTNGVMGGLRRLTTRLNVPDRMERLLGSLRIEAAVGCVVILITALLSATPPPVPPEVQNRVAAPAETASTGTIQVKLIIDPDAPDINTYEADVSQDGQPLQGAQVALRFLFASLDNRSLPVTLDDAGNGVYLSAGPELQWPGDWNILVDILPAGSPSGALPTRVAFRWNLPTTAPVATSREASLLNWLAALVILVALGITFMPTLARRIRTIPVQPEIITGGIVATIALVIMVMLGINILADSARRTALLRNPTPVVVNPVFADNASLQVGKQIYESQCTQCHGLQGMPPAQQAGTPPPDLRYRLPERRDEALYSLIRNHLGLPSQLTDQQIWNVINYLRSANFVLVAATNTP